MMKRFFAAAVLMAVGAQALSAQALNYDPYYVMPGEAKTVGADLGLSTPDVSKIGETSDVDLMGKYSINDEVEVGARATFGFLNDGADSFSAITVGAKYALQENTALTLNITPFNEAEEIGLSLGAMHSLPLADMDAVVNNQLQIGLLDAYAPVGVAVDLLIQPAKAVNDQFTAYLDLLVSTNTDDAAEYLSVRALPNVDAVLGEGLTLNAGVFFSLASGDFAADTELGLVVTLLRDMQLQ